ncbi:transporter substrate-binding domain-containing protein [Streptomyces polyrhachis]|uniref:Transporter substrate-binding domain-containing protein n=1 Tax=Streptomyces polyrhachis TaxID=1282885 RepID=A0ABW2GQY9_9ACTN
MVEKIRRSGRRGALRAALLAVALLAVPAAAGCGASSAAPGGGAPHAPAAPAAFPAADCIPDRYTPRPARIDGPAVQRIRDRGHLLAAVDVNSYLWASLGRESREPEGFEVDVVRAIAEDILGPGARVKYISMPPYDRIPRLRKHHVDVLVRAMSVSCARVRQVAFSAPYFETGHRLVTPEESPIADFGPSVRGKRVCYGKGSSAGDLFRRSATGAVAVEAESHLDCVVEVTQGRADAILTHATLGAGLVAQDPTLHLVGPRLDTSLYAVAMHRDDQDLVRRVNAVLEEYRRGGAHSRWTASYDRWLRPLLGPAPGGPPPVAYTG